MASCTRLAIFGILVLKDFGSVLSMHRDQRAAVLAALREIYDGSWTRHVGMGGGKTLSWEGKLGLLAGVTPTIDRYHAVMGAMGERFVLLRLPSVDGSEQAQRALAHAGREREMRAELGGAVAELFAGFDPELGRPRSLVVIAVPEEGVALFHVLRGRKRLDGQPGEPRQAPFSGGWTRVEGFFVEESCGAASLACRRLHSRSFSRSERCACQFRPDLRSSPCCARDSAWRLTRGGGTPADPIPIRTPLESGNGEPCVRACRRGGRRSHHRVRPGALLGSGVHLDGYFLVSVGRNSLHIGLTLVTLKPLTADRAIELAAGIFGRCHGVRRLRRLPHERAAKTRAGQGERCSRRSSYPEARLARSRSNLRSCALVARAAA